MSILSKLVTGTAFSSIHKLFTSAKVIASSNFNILHWSQSIHTHNDIVRKLSFRIVFPKNTVKNRAKRSIETTKRLKAVPYSADDDKIIMEHVKQYGDHRETWKILAGKIGRKYWWNIQQRYLNVLISEPSTSGKFTLKEDKIILENFAKNVRGNNNYTICKNIAKQLGRGSPNSIIYRHEYLTTNKEKKNKIWDLVDEQKMMEQIFRVKQIKPDDIPSLCSLRREHFRDMSKEWQRTPKSCLMHWNERVLPVLKTYWLGLPQNTDWMRDLQRYIVDKNIKSTDELKYDLLVDQLFPGQTVDSMKTFITGSQYKRVSNRCVLHNIPLCEVMSNKLRNPPPNSMLSSEKNKNRMSQYAHDIIKLYERYI